MMRVVWLMVFFVAAPRLRGSRIERLKENIDIFDFELTAHEMTDVRALRTRSGRIVDWSYSPEWD